MTTPWYQKALEAMGFDILLIGALFVLTVLIVREMWKDTTTSPFSAFYQGWVKFSDYFGLNTGANTSNASVLATVKAIGSGVAVLLLAAVAGMTLDAFAHRLLDLESETSKSRAGLDSGDQSAVKEPPDFPLPCEGSCFKRKIKFGWPEDEIKREAFDATAAVWTRAWHPKLKAYFKDDEKSSQKECKTTKDQFLKSYSDSDSDPKEMAERYSRLCPIDQNGVHAFLRDLARLRKLEEGQAKELYQEAHVRILNSTNTEIKTDLSRDQLFIKLFRVMFVLTLILFFANLRTVVRKPGWPGLIMAAILACMSLLFLYTWSQESRHYYKKVYHAYATLESDRGPFAPPLVFTSTNGSTSYYPDKSDATKLLKAIAKLQDMAKDKNNSDLQSAMRSKNRDILLSFDFYNCLLNGCARYDKALSLTEKEHQAWLECLRASLHDAGFVDGRTAAILSAAEALPISVPSPPPPPKPNVTTKPNTKVQSR